jgi:hypothetical protein
MKRQSMYVINSLWKFCCKILIQKCKERKNFKSTVWNKSLFEISIDNVARVMNFAK